MSLKERLLHAMSKYSMKTVNLPYGIVIGTPTNSEGGGIIVSNLAMELLGDDNVDEEDLEVKSISDAIESLLLAMASNGIDMTDPRISKSIVDSVEALAQKMES
jgi:nucleoside-diphosphate-sugar epimerase